jgi:hypothetical protein
MSKNIEGEVIVVRRLSADGVTVVLGASSIRR